MVETGLPEATGDRTLDRSSLLSVAPADYFAIARLVRSGRRAFIFLDYDGTLTPIVSNPKDAKLGADMLVTLQRLSAEYPVYIVTGRGRSTIFEFMSDLAGSVSFAASHGFDIESAGNGERLQVGGESQLPQLRDFEKELVRRVEDSSSSFPAGCAVEDTFYTVSLHYRNVTPTRQADVEPALDGLLSQFPGLRKLPGKMVYEVRLDVDWNKGKAVEWILKSHGVDTDDDDVVSLYIGDDVTDEDGFRALRKYKNGISIIVAPEESLKTRHTAANFHVNTVADVHRLLDVIASSAPTATATATTNCDTHDDKIQRDI